MLITKIIKQQFRRQISIGDVFEISSKKGDRRVTISKVQENIVKGSDANLNHYEYNKRALLNYLLYDLSQYKTYQDDISKLEDKVKNLTQELTDAKQRLTSVFTVVPGLALRFIIVYNHDTKEYKWIFSKTTTASHSELAQAVENTGLNVDVSGGGFYNLIYANAKLNYLDSNKKMVTPPDTLHLFGKSDSYGLRYDTFTKALTYLKFDGNLVYDELTQYWKDNGFIKYE